MCFRLTSATKKTRLLLEIHVATTAPAQDPGQAKWEAVCCFPSLSFLLEAALPWKKKHGRGGFKLSSVFSQCNTEVVPSFPRALVSCNLLPSQLQNKWAFCCRRWGFPVWCVWWCDSGYDAGIAAVIPEIYNELPEVLHESKSTRP